MILRSIRILAIAAGLAAAAMAAPAQAQWAGKGQLGYVLSRGNSDASTLNGKVDATDTVESWTHGLGASVLRAATSGVTSANRYELHGQSNYRISPASYLFGGARYEHDAFSSFAHQAVLDGGYGYKFVDTADTKLNGELGVGYRRSAVRLTGQSEGDAIWRGAMNYETAFNASTKLIEKLAIESGSKDTFITNDLALQVKMSDKLALNLDYSVRHHSAVSGPTVYKTDQLTTANLVFSF